MKKKITVLGLCGNSVFLSVDHFHQPGETVSALHRYAEPGGKGYNQAVAAARLGAEVSFITCIGDDSDGRMCMEFLEKEGVAPIPQVHPSLPSAYACILTDAAGDNRVTVYRGAADHLTADFIRTQESVIAESDLLLLNNEYPAECNTTAMELAQKHDVPVMYNPAPAMETDKSFLQSCRCVTPNLSETALLLGITDCSLPELKDAFRKGGIPCAVVTLGGDGAALFEGETALHFPPCQTTAVDTTGAGDCFTAALSVALLDGKTSAEAVVWAMNAAALSVSKPYVMPSLPKKAELEKNYQPLHPTTISNKE